MNTATRASKALPIVRSAIQSESDVAGARQRARRIAELLGFDRRDQTRIATAVSELARNAFSYAGAGEVQFLVEVDTTPQVFLARIAIRGRASRTSTTFSAERTSPRRAWASVWSAQGA